MRIGAAGATPDPEPWLSGIVCIALLMVCHMVGSILHQRSRSTLSCSPLSRSTLSRSNHGCCYKRYSEVRIGAAGAPPDQESWLSGIACSWCATGAPAPQRSHTAGTGGRSASCAGIDCSTSSACCWTTCNRSPVSSRHHTIPSPFKTPYTIQSFQDNIQTAVLSRHLTPCLSCMHQTTGLLSVYISA